MSYLYTVSKQATTWARCRIGEKVVRYVARYSGVKKLKATPQIFFTQQGESLVRCSAKGSIGLVAHACHSARKVPDHDVSW